MDKETLKYILAHSTRRRLPAAVPRTLALPHDTGKVIALVGIRRSGKTFLLQQVERVAVGQAHVGYDDKRRQLSLEELLARSIPDIAADDIFERLNERERLGCTSLEQGVAFPHCRVNGLNESVAAMIKLSEPVDFDAPDGEPVDLVFGRALDLRVLLFTLTVSVLIAETC